MKPSLIPAAVLFCALPACAQVTGTSHPEQLNDSITTPQQAPAKPSPAVPMDQGQAASYPNGQVQEYQPADQPQAGDHYVKPSHGDDAAYPAQSSGSRVIHQPVSSLPLNEQLADQPGGGDPAPAYGAEPAYQAQQTSPPLTRRPESYDAAPIQRAPHETFSVTDDPTSGVVMDVPSAPNELPQATLLRTRLVTSLSTRLTHPGDHFIATLATDVVRNSRVLLPAGSTLHGRVTAAHGGHGLGNASVLRLEANSITLPDGTTFPLQAEVVDVARSGSHVTAEGAIVDDAMTRGQATMLGATTGGGAVTGALVGGGVGAAVGATIGAGVGTVLYLRRDREQTLPANAELVFALDTPLNVEVARAAARPMQPSQF